MAFARAASTESCKRLARPCAPSVSAANATCVAASSRSARRRLSFSILPRPHRGGVNLQHVKIPLDRRHEHIDANNGLASDINARLCAGRRLFDTLLGQSALDRLRHPAQTLDLVHVRFRPRGQFVGDALDVIRAAPGVDDLRRSCLLDEKKLSVAGDTSRKRRWQRQRFIERVGVKRLGMPLRRRHRLDLRPHDIVEGVLSGKRPAGSLTMRAQRERFLRSSVRSP